MIDRKVSEMLIKTHKELEDAVSMKVKINNDQVLSIVAVDLLAKYSSCLEREPSSDNTLAFETVLIYYFGTDDVKEIKNKLESL